MAARWITGWLLNEGERAGLLTRFPPLFPDVIAHHVTLRTGTDETTPLPRGTCGEIVGEVDDGLGLQTLVVRIGGTTCRDDGSTYHCTWSLDLAAGRRAVESNTLLAEREWRTLPDAVPLMLIPARFRSG